MTPKITTLHGPAIRGSRLSRGSRSGFARASASNPAGARVRPVVEEGVMGVAILPGTALSQLLAVLAGSRTADGESRCQRGWFTDSPAECGGQRVESGGPVPEVEADHRSAVVGQYGTVAPGLRDLQCREGVRTVGDRPDPRWSRRGSAGRSRSGGRPCGTDRSSAGTGVPNRRSSAARSWSPPTAGAARRRRPTGRGTPESTRSPPSGARARNRSSRSARLVAELTRSGGP